MQRRRLMMPPHPVLAPLAWQVLTTPPTDEEIHLLTEVVEEAQKQNLEPAEIETRLRATRIWHRLKVMAKNDVRIATDLMLGVVRLGELATGVTFACWRNRQVQEGSRHGDSENPGEYLQDLVGRRSSETVRRFRS